VSEVVGTSACGFTKSPKRAAFLFNLICLALAAACADSKQPLTTAKVPPLEAELRALGWPARSCSIRVARIGLDIEDNPPERHILVYREKTEGSSMRIKMECICQDGTETHFLTFDTDSIIAPEPAWRVAASIVFDMGACSLEVSSSQVAFVDTGNTVLLKFEVTAHQDAFHFNYRGWLACEK
jgi:hypothetical protein